MLVSRWRMTRRRLPKRLFLLVLLVFALCNGIPNRGGAQAQAQKQKSKPGVCELERKLLDAEKLELFSLKPNYYRFERSKLTVPGQEPPAKPVAEEGFHDHLILGSIVLKSPKVQRQLVQQLLKNFHEPGNIAECFEPHHGLRIYDKGTTADLVMCFDCGQMDTFGIRDSGDLHVGAKVPVLFYTLFRDFNIPYEGPRPHELEHDTGTTTSTKGR